MEIKELLTVSLERKVEIALHLPEYEGIKLLLIGGAITTYDLYANWDESLCHLFEDGTIKRYGNTIGNIEDIEILNIIEL